MAGGGNKRTIQIGPARGLLIAAKPIAAIAAKNASCKNSINITDKLLFSNQHSVMALSKHTDVHHHHSATKAYRKASGKNHCMHEAAERTDIVAGKHIAE